jgi:hypothetical protein
MGHRFHFEWLWLGVRRARGMCRATTAFAVLCVAITLGVQSAGCGSDGAYVHVQTANGEQASVSRFRTFGVVLPDPEELSENFMKPETFQKLAQLSIDEMKARGYAPVDAQQAELLIGFSPGLTLAHAVRVYNQDKTGRPDSDPLTQQATGEGRLTVSFVDTRARQIVLTRVAQTRVNTQLGEGQMRELISSIFAGTPRSSQ